MFFERSAALRTLNVVSLRYLGRVVCRVECLIEPGHTLISRRDARPPPSAWIKATGSSEYVLWSAGYLRCTSSRSGTSGHPHNERHHDQQHCHACNFCKARVPWCGCCLFLAQIFRPECASSDPLVPTNTFGTHTDRPSTGEDNSSNATRRTAALPATRSSTPRAGLLY